MAYITLNAPIIWPGNTLALHGASAPTIGALDTIDSTNALGDDATAFILCAPKDLALSHIGWRCHSATSSPTAKVRVEQLDAAGMPSGTLWAANTNGTSGVLTTAQNAPVALGATANIAKGQMFAVLITWNSIGTFSVSSATVGSAQYFTNPYKTTNISGAWATKAGGQGWAIALGSSATDFYWMPGCYPVTTTIGSNAFNNTSSARRGARFRPPFDCYVSGFRYLPSSSIGDLKAYILDSSNVELNTSGTLVDGNHQSESIAGCENLFFDTEVGPLLQGNDYYLAIEPQSATNCNMYTWTLLNNNYRKAFPGGVDFDYATGTPTMAAVDTQVPLLDLWISRVPIAGADPVGGTGGAHVIGI